MFHSSVHTELGYFVESHSCFCCEDTSNSSSAGAAVQFGDATWGRQVAMDKKILQSRFASPSGSITEVPDGRNSHSTGGGGGCCSRVLPFGSWNVSLGSSVQPVASVSSSLGSSSGDRHILPCLLFPELCWEEVK